MTTLKIHLLGPFQVILEGEPITNFGADSARALLAYLALHPGAPLRRETLAALLWPDVPESDALRALRQALNRVRTAIGDRQAEPPFLEVSRQTLTFDPESDYWLDVNAFEEHLAATREHAHRRLAACRSCLHHLRQASDLYRGDLLQGFNLDSLPFEEWLLVERERLHCQAVDVLHDLTRYHEAHGDFPLVQRYARRQLELEPWREEAHRQLMRALALTDQHSAALAQYRRCQEVLTAELGVAPTEQTQALFQQLREGPLTPALPPTNLPQQLGPFVGRRTELQHAIEQLNRPDCRLLTLVGIGGVGKTRLALQVGYEERYNFRDGVFYVPLAALDVPEQLGAALARALNFSLHTGQNPWQELRAYLRPKELLLILDNFEHLLPGAGRISELLQYAPEVVVLVTSRERLSVQGEWVVPVTGMRYPRTEDLTPSEAHGAVRLFLEGARRLRPGFEPTPEELRAIVRICRLVEGLPLALELAAPWLRVLSCQEIVQEIERDIDFLEGARQDLPDRHRSLRAVFDHSWQLLSPPEQQVFKHLAVFRGAFSREAAEAVAGATPALLAALEDQSLLQIETHSGGTSRYDLHDLVQRYAAEKLARDPVGELTLRERHAEYYLTWVAQQRASLKGRGQKESVAALERELAQIRAAWSYATQSGIPELLRPALESLFLFYDLQSRFPEGVALFRAACDLFAQEGEEGEDLGFGLACQGWFVACSTDLAQGRDLLEEALSLLSKGDPRLRAFTLDHLGSILLELSEYEEAEEACEEALSLYQALDDAYGEVQTLNALGQMMYLQGECERARAYCEEGLRQAEAIGLSRTIGDGLRQMGTLLYFMGNHTEAQAYYEQALVRYRESRNRWGESSTLVSLAGVTSRQGDHVAAQTYLQEALQIAREIGDRSNEGDILNSLGLQCTYEGELDRALRFQEQALTIKEELGERMGEGHVLNNLTNTLWLLGQFEGARACAERALKIQQEIGYRRGEGFTLLALGTLAWHEGQPIEAREWSLAALNIAREINERFIEARALLHLGRAFQALGEFEAAEECYREAMALHQTLRRKHTAWLPLVELVGLLHEEGRLEEAQAAVDEILAYLTEHPIEEVTDEPSEIYLPCYRVLQTRGDPRARKVLREAYEELQQRAARIGRSDLRRAFLEKVPGNRAIVEAYEALMESEKRGAGTPRTPTESQPA